MKLIVGCYRGGRDGWWKRGRSCIKLSCEPTGSGCKEGRVWHRSSRRN